MRGSAGFLSPGIQAIRSSSVLWVVVQCCVVDGIQDRFLVWVNCLLNGKGVEGLLRRPSWFPLSYVGVIVHRPEYYSYQFCIAFESQAS